MVVHSGHVTGGRVRGRKGSRGSSGHGNDSIRYEIARRCYGEMQGKSREQVLSSRMPPLQWQQNVGISVPCGSMRAVCCGFVPMMAVIMQNEIVREAGEGSLDGRNALAGVPEREPSIYGLESPEVLGKGGLQRVSWDVLACSSISELHICAHCRGIAVSVGSKNNSGLMVLQRGMEHIYPDFCHVPFTLTYIWC